MDGEAIIAGWRGNYRIGDPSCLQGSSLTDPHWEFIPFEYFQLIIQNPQRLETSHIPGRDWVGIITSYQDPSADLLSAGVGAQSSNEDEMYASEAAICMFYKLFYMHCVKMNRAGQRGQTLHSTVGT